MTISDTSQEALKLRVPKQPVILDSEGWTLQVSDLVDDLRSGEEVEKVKVLSGLELVGKISELAVDASVETKIEILRAGITIRDRALAADELGLIQPPLTRREKRSFKDGVTNILFDLNLLSKIEE